jgi:hypothetical protein
MSFVCQQADAGSVHSHAAQSAPSKTRWDNLGHFDELGRRDYRRARERRNPELRLAAPAAILELFGKIQAA